MYAMSIDTFAPMLRSLSANLDKGAQHMDVEKRDGAELVNARLAPDMFTLARQVQIACDHAKNGSARLMGREAPRFEDDEQTLDELKARIAKTLSYMAGAPVDAFEGAEDRKIIIPGPGETVFEMTGLQYLRDWALPHFYFHVVTAYDILRHSGVAIGKRDYVGDLVGGYMRPGGAAGA
jgi:hypothetical protein